MNRRVLYFLLVVVTIPAGLLSRNRSLDLPYLYSTYGGDVLSATCFFFGVRFLATKTALYKIALYSYLICIAIETLQLYHAPWIEKIRHTPPFGILLGYGFLWSDWICYAVGVLIAWIIAYFLEKTLKHRLR
jgi:hypothetical protein